METAWLPDFLYTGGRFISGAAFLCDSSGRITRISKSSEGLHSAHRLPNRAVLPGMVNAHSHSFQRAIRGRTEHRTSANLDTFWTWREAMYRAANKLSAEDVYHVARMAFLEMLLSGITTVGEFHYLHFEGAAQRVIEAAHDVGIRINLQRTAYVRAGFNQPPNPLQARFITPHAEDFIANSEALRSWIAQRNPADRAWVSVAPHSVRAVPLPYLREIVEYARANGLKIHMHAAEQPAEIEACQAEYGMRPIELLRRNEILDPSFTAVHAIHIIDAEIADFRDTGARVCACPTTERNLGDGIGPVDRLASAGVGICYGTDSNAQIDLLEDARELEYHLRLDLLQRAVLARDPGVDELAARLFRNATETGAESVGADAGSLEPGRLADFFTVDLDDPSIAGATPGALLSNIVFSGGRSAIRDVIVGAKRVIEEGRHPMQKEIVSEFAAVQARLWSES